jgi:hypothetical protein
MLDKLQPACRQVCPEIQTITNYKSPTTNNCIAPVANGCRGFCLPAEHIALGNLPGKLPGIFPGNLVPIGIDMDLLEVLLIRNLRSPADGSFDRELFPVKSKTASHFRTKQKLRFPNGSCHPRENRS